MCTLDFTKELGVFPKEECQFTGPPVLHEKPVP